MYHMLGGELKPSGDACLARLAPAESFARRMQLRPRSVENRAGDAAGLYQRRTVAARSDQRVDLEARHVTLPQCQPKVDLDVGWEDRELGHVFMFRMCAP